MDPATNAIYSGRLQTRFVVDGDNPVADDVSIQLLERVRTGDEQAAADLFDRYVNRLIGLTRNRLSGKLARRVDPEDIVQSAYRSFFLRAQDGQFTLERSGDLWRLLTAITLNKLRMQAKYHGAQKRSMGDEESIASGSMYGVAPERVATEPTPDDAAALEEQLERIMGALKPLERQMLEMRLQSYTIDEIAAEVGRSERTVRRLLDRLKTYLEQELSGSLPL